MNEASNAGAGVGVGSRASDEDGGRSAEWKSEDFQISIEEERGRDFKIQKERLQFYPFRRG